MTEDKGPAVEALIAFQEESVTEGWHANDKHILASLRRIPLLEADLERMRGALNTPEVHDFAKGVVVEAQHQRHRWPSEHDIGKSPFDWFWLIGYLAQKAAASQVAGDTEKALHHTISTAAALANWHAAISGSHSEMCPGLPLPARQALEAKHD